MYNEAPAIPQYAIPAPTKMPRAPEVKSQMERLSTALANLEDTASFLGQRLEFVLTPDAPTASAVPAGQPINARSDMAAAVDLLEQRVQSVNRLLNSLMDRLEV